jgi:glucose dehydrogenase
MMRKLVVFLSIAVVVASVAVVAVQAQKGEKLQNPYLKLAKEAGAQVQAVAGGKLLTYDHALTQVDAATSTDWVLHNGDLSNTRFSSLDQINTSNVSSLVPRWQFQTGLTSNPQSTAVVVNGVMYATSEQGDVHALDAATGERIWSYRVGNLFGGGERGITNRGVTYGDGNVYVATGPDVIALDAKTGQPLQSFGTNGVSDVLLKWLQGYYPNANITTPIEYGYAYTMAPQFYKGLVIVGTTLSEVNIPGGLVFALDAKTGALKWKFNTIPQGPADEGWNIAKDTWVGGARNGAGVWETPPIDSDLGMIYIQASNTTPDLDGTQRIGTNLFACSIIALDVATGKIKWYFQNVHHDVWDYDQSAPATLFDVQVGGKMVKAIASPNKNGYVYILNRQTGQPINPILEIPVSTVTDVPGEKPWPTQPVPYTSRLTPQEVFVPIFNTKNLVNNPDIPQGQTPVETTWCTAPSLSKNKPLLHAPGVLGGANFAPTPYSPLTGLIYVTGIDFPVLYTTEPLGSKLLKPGEGSFAGPLTLIGPGTGTLTAYDPATSELVWQAQLPGYQQAGSVVTAGNLVFVGDSTGYFYAFDASSGKLMWKYNLGSYVKSSPTVYSVNGKEFIAVNAGDDFVAFGLP